MRVRLVKELTEVANKHFNTVEKDTKINMSSIDAYLNKMLEKFSLLPMFMETMILQFSKDPNSKCAGTRDPKVMKKVSADALKDPKKDGPAGAVSTSGGPPDGSNSTGKGPDAAKAPTGTNSASGGPPVGTNSASGGPPDGSNSTGKGPDAAKPVIPKDEKGFRRQPPCGGQESTQRSQ